MATQGKSRLTEIYMMEKSQGRGAVSAIDKRTLEKVDSRQIFNQQVFLAAFLPSLFRTYKAPTPIKKEKTLDSKSSMLGDTTKLETKIEELITENKISRVNSNITAKSVMVLPQIARDMNLMRQNISKLVKLGDRTSANKADTFFKKSEDRERAYESKFEKSKSPTQVGARGKDDKKAFGFLDFVKSFLMAFLAGITSLAVIGGLVAGIGQLLKDKEMREKVKEFLVNAFVAIFEGMKEIFKVSGDTLSDPKVVKAMVDAAKEFFIQLKNVITSILSHGVETEYGKFSLGGILASLIGAFVAFKIALKGLSGFIVGLGLRAGVGGAAAAPAAAAAARKIFKLKGGGFNLKKLILTGVLIAGTYYAVTDDGELIPQPEGTKVDPNAPELKPEDIQEVSQNGQADTPTDKFDSALDRLERAGDQGGDVVNSATVAAGSYAAKKLIQPSLDARVTAAQGGQLTFDEKTGRYKRNNKFVSGKNEVLGEHLEKMRKWFLKNYNKPGFMSKLLARIGPRVGISVAVKLSAFVGGLVAAPFSGGFSSIISLISIASLAWTAYEFYELYNALFGPDNLADQIESELDAESKLQQVVVPTFASPEENNIPETVQNVATVATRPSPAPAAAAPDMRAGRGFNRATVSNSTAATPSVMPSGSVFDSWDLYTKVVGQSESGNQYNTRYGVFNGKATINGKLVTENTIGEIIQWQNAHKAKKTNEHGVGKYGFLYVEDFAKLAGLSHDQLFDADAQEKMMMALTESNKKVLSGKGYTIRSGPRKGEFVPGLNREPEMWEMQLAHSVGAGGALDLINKQNIGLGGTSATEQLGLSGTGVSTNPQLQKTIDRVIADSKAKFSTGAVAGIKSSGAGNISQGATPSTTEPKKEEFKLPDLNWESFSKSAFRNLSPEDIAAKQALVEQAKNAMVLSLPKPMSALQPVGNVLDSASRGINEKMTELSTLAPVIIRDVPRDQPIPKQKSQSMSIPIPEVADTDFVKILVDNLITA